jgi:leucine dehydrogenase
VGAYLADKLAAEGARLTLTDVNEAVLHAVAERTSARIVAPGEIFEADVDVFAPCALGGAITTATVQKLTARVVAGGANNQLADHAAGVALQDRGILYAPDFVINGGGIINVAAEIRGLDRNEPYDPAWVEMKMLRMIETLEEVLSSSQADGRLPQDVAIDIAKARIAAARKA